MRPIAPAGAQLIRAQVANGVNCASLLDEYDTFPASTWRVYTHAPHGFNAVFLAVCNDMQKKAGIMMLSKTAIKMITRDFHAAQSAKLLMDGD